MPMLFSDQINSHPGDIGRVSLYLRLGKAGADGKRVQRRLGVARNQLQIAKGGQGGDIVKPRFAFDILIGDFGEQCHRIVQILDRQVIAQFGLRRVCREDSRRRLRNCALDVAFAKIDPARRVNIGGLVQKRAAGVECPKREGLLRLDPQVGHARVFRLQAAQL